MSLIILNVDEVRRTLSASVGAFVVHDKEVDIVRFAINSGFADIVLDGQVALRVMYQRPGETEVRAQTLTYYDTDGLHNYYDWQLLSADLAKKGSLTVALCILDISGGEVSEWHTTPYQIRVLDTIHTDDSDEADGTITPTVAQRVAVLESMIQRVASGAPVVVGSVSDMTDTAQIYVLSTDGMWYYHNGTAWTAGGEYGAVATDTTLTQSRIPADAEAVGDKIAEVNERLDQLDGGGMTEEAKQALLNLVSHIGLWDDDHGQDYIDALEAALYPPARLTRITAVYTQSGVVYEGSDINNLKPDLVVTAVYSDSTSEVITAYTLTGTLEEGTSTITVSYGGKTTTFDVTVTGQLLPSGYRLIEYVGADGGQMIVTSIKPREFPIRIETRFHKTSQAGGEQALVMSVSASNGTLFELGYSATANTMFVFSQQSAKITNPIVNGNVADIVAEFNSESPYKTLSITANGETVTAQSTDANATNILNNTYLYLFAARTAANGIIGRMYSCKIYSGGNLLGDFIPCYSESEERAGMYDLVTETFYKSTGLRAFIKGGDV